MIKPRSAYGWVKVMVVLMIFSSAFLFGGMKRFAAEWETGSWPRTRGTVLSVQVVELSASLSERRSYGPYDRGPDRSPRFRSVVRYEYRVADRDYVGTRVSLHQKDYRDHYSAAISTAGYRPGQAVDVRYSPDAPQLALLKAGVRPWTFVVVFIGFTVTLFAGFMIRNVLKHNGTAGWKRQRGYRATA